MGSLHEVAHFRSVEEARVVVGLLQAYGIEASLADSHMHAVLPIGLPFNHYRVMAPASQIGDARAILDQIEDSGRT